MALSKQETQTIIEKFGKSTSDSGSTSVQIALLTERLKQLTEHFKGNKHDHHSRRGLMKVVGQRRKLLRYLHKKDSGAYRTIISELGLRK